jgi:hypothetical protein
MSRYPAAHVFFTHFSLAYSRTPSLSQTHTHTHTDSLTHTLSLLGQTALAMLYHSPWRFPLQFFFSFGELYGCILYFGIAWWDGFAYSLPDPLYFGFYFVFMNVLWIVFPALLCWQAASRTAAAFAIAAKVQGTSSSSSGKNKAR